MPKKTTHRRNSNKTQQNMNQEKPNIPTSNPHDVLAREVQVPDKFIIDADEANKEIPHFSFFNRVLSIPLIRDSSTIVQHYANQNSISRFALNKAESTFKIAASMASPYAEKYKPHLLKADQLGCQSLDLVETKFPVVTQPPQKVYEDVKDKITYAASLPVTRTTSSLQQLINKYLPPTDEKQRQAQEEKDLINQVKDRLSYRLQHSKADLARLGETNQLLHETFQSIQKANTHLHDFLVSIKGYKDTTQTKANQRMHELTTDLIHRLDAAAAYVKDRQVMNNLPHSVHIVIDPLVTFASNEYDIVRTEVLKPDVAPLQKATNILQMTQGYVLPLIQKSIHDAEEQVRQYGAYATNNYKVVRDVKTTFDNFAKVKA
ncbi:uncharacterized protein B0P05DRAFT_536845 [Gilbertella persicaria]|uniref:Uncharacterized protein n=1 Tax=Rhizopus stolonifer TaxID=4846 RepID=A0A367K229_RHIST|nr:uncharacterized protein B0P05DRAFT_536845 [Gilbertella persicaria]KAI8083303.1 hypothetical protein B0P05DRAFT_536845 [Gilbertella persicaria]RCH96264.1 hypothetical protein CU098_007020 [Rhizopus stolonifer]